MCNPGNGLFGDGASTLLRFYASTPEYMLIDVYAEMRSILTASCIQPTNHSTVQTGRQLQSSLQDEGIDTEGVVIDEDGESTGMSMIISADDGTGKNTVACLGANQCCGKEELDIANRYMRSHPEIGILLMQNEVTHNAIVRLARIAHNARKMVVFKASPIREAADVSEDLYPKIDVLVVNEYEAPILLGWVETQPDRFPLRNLQHAMLAAKELQETKKCSAIVILSPFGHVCRIQKEGKVSAGYLPAERPLEAASC